MCKLLKTISLCAAALAIGHAVAQTPTPSIVPVSWTLRITFSDPQRVSVFLPGQDQPVVYWYMLYRVENDTDQEVDFYPRFDLVTDTLQVIHNELKVSPEAFRAIQRRSGDPLLLTPERVMGRLLRGEDRARHSVAIWRDFDPKTRAFQVYAMGLSGETIRLKNPGFDPSRPESDGNPRYFTLRKALEIPYLFPGSPATRSTVTPVRLAEQQKWIMR